MSKRITEADLEESGVIIRVLFGKMYPRGLTEKQMEEEGKKHDWVARALARWREKQNDIH